jgi:transposase
MDEHRLNSVLQPTALAKSTDVFRLLGEGMIKVKIADKLCIGIASIYRIVGTQKAAA